jgi:hypothetical protein
VAVHVRHERRRTTRAQKLAVVGYMEKKTLHPATFDQIGS